jgi:hypothetical protein
MRMPDNPDKGSADPSSVANDKVHAAARLTVDPAATIPTDPHPLAGFPAGHLSADRIYGPGNFVSRQSRVRDVQPLALFYKRVPMANTTGLNLDPHPPGTGLWNFALNQLGRQARAWEPSRAHLRRSFLQSALPSSSIIPTSLLIPPAYLHGTREHSPD